MDKFEKRQVYGPWNPGLRSTIPSNIRPFSTLLRFENVDTPLLEADELASFSGLRAEKIVKLKPERLVVHELLVRVTANFSVPHGSDYQHLGKNFRKVVKKIFKHYIEPIMGEIVQAYDDMDTRMNAQIHDELMASLFKPSHSNSANKDGFLSWLRFSSKKYQQHSPQPDKVAEEKEFLRNWQEKEKEAEEYETQIIYQTLIAVITSIQSVHGIIWGDLSLIASLVNNISCNIYGSKLVGDIIEPLTKEAAKRECLRLVSVQEKPIIMNTKGASASGKSTLLPLQKILADELGVDWNDFALISPDIWRKFLLDYDSLGDAYKYAGALTGDEIALIDQKLDAYMSRKGEDGRMSHLLIDRFRFDSFAPISDDAAGSTLLTRFGKEVYLFFMITPPEETVERAWKRGEEVGRYKAVDDLLYHNVEAFTGMPRLFFTWALKMDKSVHYEFLDNNVPLGERPKTVAFGVNGVMTILDVRKMLDVQRYRKINLNGSTPTEVYPDPEKMSADRNTEFLQECARLIPSITFADQATGRIYGKIERGQMKWTDGDILASVIEDDDTKAGLETLAGSLPEDLAGQIRYLDASNVSTLGQWGGGA